MGVYSEQMEYPHYPEHTEYNKAAEVEKRQYRQKINYTVKGSQEPQPCG